MEKPKITVYGTSWCSDCHLVLKIFKTQNIEYLWIDIDKDLSAEQFVIKTNHGFRSVPTILFEDGSILVEPTARELQKKLLSFIQPVSPK